MKTDCDVTKLKFQSLTDDDQLAAATQALQSAEQVALKVVALPKREAARKALAQHFAKDRLRPAKQAPKPFTEKNRGGRQWRNTQRGSVLREVKMGDICVIPKDFNLLQALPGLREYIEVAPA
ncbi:MAG: hypothetical protein JSU68_13465 [Phycisphaerales bacterium]|nr:MAG: hypothetical protein JSU68_13465 [Phycisphaerales bacterium]